MSKRVVVQGKVITAAGVSSGIDMALTLAAAIAGDEIAQAIQLGIEYDPQPPFHSGSVATAPAGLSSPEDAPARAIRPSATASATTLVSSETLRIASSLPGIG